MNTMALSTTANYSKSLTNQNIVRSLQCNESIVPLIVRTTEFLQGRKFIVWLSICYLSKLDIIILLHCVSKKVPTFKISVTLSNLNRFSNFCTDRKRMKFATKPYDITHLTLCTLSSSLPWEIKNSNLQQIFSRYERKKCKQIAFLLPLTLLFIHNFDIIGV